MSTISKTHEEFSERLSYKKLRVLSHPQEFLGPNFEAVLNFWLILETNEENYEAFNNLTHVFRRNSSPDYWELREQIFDNSPISSPIKVLLMNLTYGNIQFFSTLRDYTAMATLELTGEHQKPLVIQHFLNEFTHS